MIRVAVSKPMRDALLLKSAGVCCVCKERNVGINSELLNLPPALCR